MFNERIVKIGLLFTAGCLCLITRLFYLQVLRADYYQDRVENRAMDLRYLPAWRGSILDRNGNVLAADELSFDVHVNFHALRNTDGELDELLKLLKMPEADQKRAKRNHDYNLMRFFQALRVDDRDFFLLRLSEISGVSLTALRKRVGQGGLDLALYLPVIAELKVDRSVMRLASLTGRNVDQLHELLQAKEMEIQKWIDRKWETSRAWKKAQPFLRGIEKPQAEQLEIHAAYYAGFSVRTSLQRSYPFGAIASAVTGYVGRINEREFETLRELSRHTDDADIPLYFSDDLVGRTGLEASHQNVLHGQRGGRVVEVDSSGKIERVLKEIPPLPGCDLTLTLDIRLHARAQELLAHSGFRGALVALNPRNGEVLALATYPTFDANWFIAPTDSQRLEQLFEDTPLNRLNAPMTNRAVRGVFPPGSTFKLVTALAALESGAVTPAFTCNCGWGEHFHIGNKRCHHPHGDTDLLLALQKSCNMYFYHLGERTGVEQLADWARRLGFGSPTGIELPEETGGIVPTPAWARRQHDQRWYPGNTIDFSIGQGYLTASPLQIAQLAAAVAEHGRFTPVHLVMNTSRDHVQTAAERTTRQHIDSRYLDYLREGMRQVTLPGGTAGDPVWGFAQMRVAGKTGTAQAGGYKPDHSWFMGYAPYDNPEIAFACLIENAGKSEVNAKSVLSQFLRFYFYGDENHSFDLSEYTGETDAPEQPEDDTETLEEGTR